MTPKKKVTSGTKFDILRRLADGATRLRVAEQFGITRQRVAQIDREYEIREPAPAKKTIHTPEDLPVTDVTIFDSNARPAFVLTFYGVDLGEFVRVPGGSDLIRAALDRRGLLEAGYSASPLHIAPARSPNSLPTVLISDGE